MRPPRLRVRTLMVAVAVVGVIGGGAILRWRERRAADYRGKYMVNVSQESVHRARTLGEERIARMLFERSKGRDDSQSSDELRRDAHRAVRAALRDRMLWEHFAQLRRKYEYATSHPWYSVPPDPPPP